MHEDGDPVGADEEGFTERRYAGVDASFQDLCQPAYPVFEDGDRTPTSWDV